MAGNHVLQLFRQLQDTSQINSVPGVVVRNYESPADIDAWLQVRQRAFAREQLGVRAWSVQDFEQELLQKSWWNPRHFWLAEDISHGSRQTIGTVTMALRGTGTAQRPAVHWLAVAPAARRRGVGRLLLATLEAAAWEAGYREVWLETHRKWEKARAFYMALGYREALDAQESAGGGMNRKD